jgi:hypothetical protein
MLVEAPPSFRAAAQQEIKPARLAKRFMFGIEHNDSLPYAPFRQRTGDGFLRRERRPACRSIYLPLFRRFI